MVHLLLYLDIIFTREIKQQKIWYVMLNPEWKLVSYPFAKSLFIESA